MCVSMDPQNLAQERPSMGAAIASGLLRREPEEGGIGTGGDCKRKDKGMVSRYNILFI